MLSIQFFTVVCFDQFGNTFKTVSSDLGDHVHIHSLKSSDGSTFQFESDLSNLRQSCKNHGIICYVSPAMIDVFF